MALVQTRADRPGTAISPTGTAHPVTITGQARRPIGVHAAGGPAVVVEVDFEAGDELGVPGRYMLELAAGDTLELEVVYGLALADGRFFFKGMAVEIGGPGAEAAEDA